MSSSFMQSATFLDWNKKTIFTKSKFVLMISGKYSANSLRSSPRCWTTSDAISTSTSSPAAVARFSNKQNFLLELFASFSSFSKFFHDCAEASVKSTVVLALLCSLRLTLYWVVEICQQDILGGKENGYHRDWVPYRFFLDRWELNLILILLSCILRDACIWAYCYAN